MAPAIAGQWAICDRLGLRKESMYTELTKLLDTYTF